MLLYNNDFIQTKKLYINHKTRRKSSSRKSSLTHTRRFPIFKQKLGLDFSSRQVGKRRRASESRHLHEEARSLKLFPVRLLSNISSNDEQKQRLLCLSQKYKTFYEKLCGQSFGGKNVLPSKTSPVNCHSNVEHHLSGKPMSLGKALGDKKAFVTAFLANDLKQRLALRKRYLRRKRKRKSEVEQQQLYHKCHQQKPQQQLLLQTPETFRPSRPISLEINATPFVDFAPETTAKVATLASGPGQQQQQKLEQQMSHHPKTHYHGDLQLSRNLAPAFGGRVQQPSRKGISSLEKPRTNNNHNHIPAMMWEMLILWAVHLSLTAIATLYANVRTALSQTAQQIVRAVIAATTLPIIQRIQQQQHETEKQQQQLQHGKHVEDIHLPAAGARYASASSSRLPPSSADATIWPRAPPELPQTEKLSSAPPPPSSSSTLLMQTKPAHKKPVHGRNFPPQQKNRMQPVSHLQYQQQQQQQLSLPSPAEPQPQHYKQQQQQQGQERLGQQVNINNITSSSNGGNTCSSNSFTATTSIAATTTTSILTLWQHCHRRYRPHQLLPLLTTKGLNKYSWIFLLIYLNLSAKGKCVAKFN
uniref:Uncharacterized protein n=1 Tax=Musca domestica TaxID=7370 RepID=A0A1I8MT02_MUSDO